MSLDSRGRQTGHQMTKNQKNEFNSLKLEGRADKMDDVPSTLTKDSSSFAKTDMFLAVRAKFQHVSRCQKLWTANVIVLSQIWNLAGSLCSFARNGMPRCHDAELACISGANAMSALISELYLVLPRECTAVLNCDKGTTTPFSRARSCDSK